MLEGVFILWYYMHMTGGNTKVGRPQMYTAEEIQEIYSDLEQYIDKTEDPTIVGFTSTYKKYRVNKDYISDHGEFSELRRCAIEKQEAYLLHGATHNELNASVSIFRLKQPQHGYRDRVDTDVTTNGNDINPYSSLTTEELRKLLDK